MSGVTKMRLKRGVSVPMDSDAIHPAALVAAVTVGIETLEQRTTAEGHVLDWDTIEICLQRPAEGSDAAMMVVRAAAVQ